MLIELLSLSNYGHFNVKLANALGLHTAIYINIITDINEKAIRKKKTEKDYFTVDRKYIEERTTLKPKEQKEIETNLKKVGILKSSSDDPDTIMLDIGVLTSIVSDPDKDLMKHVSSIVKKTPAQTKLENISITMKEQIITLEPEQRKAWFDWIDAVLQKDGWMTKQAVISGQATLGAFAQGNPEIVKKVLEIASINGYRDLNWAISSYKKDYQPTIRIADTPMVRTESEKSISKEDQPPVIRRRISNEVF